MEFKPIAQFKGIDLVIEKQDDKTILIVDEYTVTQIFQNLLDNAIKYTKSGTIKTSVKNVDDLVIVEIKDTGIGIDNIYIDKIFEIFSQEEQGYSRCVAMVIGIIIFTIFKWDTLKKYIMPVVNFITWPFRFFYKGLKWLYTKIFKRKKSTET